jgi:hypothetical protein
MSIRFISCTGGALLGVLLVSAVGAARPSYRSLCDSAQTHMHTGSYDTAMYYYARAHNRGMSKDSLYFLWARVYLHKGVLDTALALNYSILAHTQGAFRREVLSQRRRVFLLLGWDERAAHIGDSLQRFSDRPRAIPTVDVSAGIGYRRYRRIDDAPAEEPDGGGAGARVTRDHLPYHAKIAATWRCGRTGPVQWDIGCAGDVAPPAYMHTVSGAFVDSLHYRLQGFIDAAWGPVPLTMSYAFVNTWDAYRQYYHMHEGFVSYLWRTRLPLFAAAGFHQEVVCSSWDAGSRLGWLMVGTSHAFAPAHTIEANLFGNLFYDEPGEVSTNVALYTTRSFNEVDLMMAFSTPPADTSFASYYVPSTMRSFTGTCRYAYRAHPRLVVGAGGDWALQYYPEALRWHDVAYYQWDSLSYLVYNQATRRMYYSLSPQHSRQFVEDNPWPAMRSARRVDHSAGTEVYFTLTCADVSLTATVHGRRSWSSLPDDAPVEIRRWAWHVALDAQVTFNAYTN